MEQPLSKTQAETLEFLRDFHRVEGYMPSVREIADHFEIAIASAHERLDRLKDKGVIKRTPGPRGIIINK